MTNITVLCCLGDRIRFDHVNFIFSKLNSLQFLRNKKCDKINRKRIQKLTTPTLTLFGLWSARKASVTPRIGSLGAGSMLRNQEDDINLAPATVLRRRNCPLSELRIAMTQWCGNREREGERRGLVGCENGKRCVFSKYILNASGSHHL